MSEDIRYECSMCGREDGPIKGCSSCNGEARYKVPAVGATLSDYRSGRVKEPERDVHVTHHDPTWQGHSRGG